METSQSFPGRVACRLFIEGWMGVILILGLFVFALVSGFATSR
jgi:hypothetical protein